MATLELLDRDTFRNAVFERDDHRCVGKYVWEGHAQTPGPSRRALARAVYDWIRQRVVPNKLADGAKVS